MLMFIVMYILKIYKIVLLKLELTHFIVLGFNKLQVL